MVNNIVGWFTVNHHVNIVSRKGGLSHPHCMALDTKMADTARPMVHHTKHIET